MTVHAIRCKLTGEALAMKLDGGTCACPSASECRMVDAICRAMEEQTEPFTAGPLKR